MMGTNFSLHLGKRSGIGDGRCAFTWAIPPALLSLLPPDFVVVEDEYGDRMTVGEFLAARDEDQGVMDSIGRWFS